MRIDESMAKGLTNRFFAETKEFLCVTFRNLTSRVSAKQSRKAAERNLRDFQEHTSRIALSNFQVKSKRSPYFSAVTAFPIQQRSFNTWNERCYTGVILPFYRHKAVKPSLCFFNISEHAIARLFYRSGHEFFDLDDVDMMAAYSVLRPVPLWVNFWLMSFLHVDYGHLPYIRPLVPCEHGFFLCETTNSQDLPFDPRLASVEIRTFISKSMFSPSQARVHEIMMSCGADLYDSALAHMAQSIFFYKDAVWGEYEMLLERMGSGAGEVFAEASKHIPCSQMASRVRSTLWHTLFALGLNHYEHLDSMVDQYRSKSQCLLGW